MTPMTPAEQQEHDEVCALIRGALSALRLSRVQDEDIRGAAARLEGWLIENDGRWVK